MAVALDSSPASSGRQPGILRDDLGHDLAWPPGRRSRSARRSRSGGRGGRAPWPAGGGRRPRRWQPGTAACTWAATEPRGGTSGWNSWPTPHEGVGHARSRPCPRGGRRTAWAVVAARSHGVAMTTRSASAAPALSAGVERQARRSGHCAEQLVDDLHGPVLRARADARPRSRPTPGGRPRPCPPGRCRRGSRCAWRSEPWHTTTPGITVLAPWVCSTASASSSPACSPTPRSRSAWPSWPRRRAPRSSSPAPAGGCRSPSARARKLPRRRRCSSSTSPSPRTSTPSATRVADEWDRVDGVLHAIGFAPPVCLGGDVHGGPVGGRGAWRCNVSAYSLKALADAFVPLMTDGGSIVGLDFDATRRLAGLRLDGRGQGRAESTSRYLARELGPEGIRVNLVAAGPVRTMAAKSIPGFSALRGRVGRRGRRSAGTCNDSSAGRQGLRRPAVGLVPADHRRDVHVDGGFHAIGA